MPYRYIGKIFKKLIYIHITFHFIMKKIVVKIPSDYNKHQRHSRVNRILFTVGADFIMHNTSLFGNMNNSVADCFWGITNGSFGSWLLSNPDSHYRIRQIFSSVYHLQRLTKTSFISAADYGLFTVLSAAAPSTFSLDNSKIRAFKRLMLTLYRNGGVYRDVYDIIENMTHSNPTYNKILKTLPFDDEDSSLQYPISRDEASDIIKNELGTRVLNQFFGFPSRPTSIRNEISMFDCFLKDGQKVTVSIMPPHLERMRKYDLVPFKLFRNLLNVSSQFKGACSLMDALFIRLDNSIDKEVSARMKILQAFGVDFSVNAKDIIRMSDRANLSLKVSPPLPHLCSTHVMVTPSEPKKKVTESSAKLTYNLSSFTSQIYKKASYIVPNLGLSNVRRSKNNISLASYASLIKVNKSKVEAAANLYSNMFIGDKDSAIQAARLLHVPRNKARRILNNDNQFFQMTKSLIPENADLVLAGGEAIGALVSHASLSTTRAMRSVMSAADLVSSLFNVYSLRIID
ncbi:hypothetical protein TRFO_10563 [Tritrichomonas foetus]|uniref:Uncharacterized protein n=1 Tax=Tritrichomonas foetus TaxID=1144522 RepID=A0A1J4JDA7_9EUKA|nr:hypothetical protein TRFO_10563 [Tritrichomonas foetus]|eukprot:OHS95413.1 hypothetical protein TRFO_10563 [Tritrichomonas foetus]